MTIPTRQFVSTLLSISALSLLSAPAIAQETETIVWPEQITNNFSGFKFTTNPFDSIQTFTLSEEDKQEIQFRTVADEANADAPRSESYNSGFKIKLNGSSSNADSSESEAVEN